MVSISKIKYLYLILLPWLLWSQVSGLPTSNPLPLLDLQPAKSTELVGETPFRRFDILFFISLPFAILYSTLADTLFSYATGLKIGIDQKTAISSIPFTYQDSSINGNVLFIGLNAVLWSSVIAYNDYFEKSDTSREDLFKSFLIKARSDIYFFRSYF